MKDRAWLELLSPDERAAVREEYEERAAIMEHDGELERAEAERLAAHGVEARWRDPERRR